MARAKDARHMQHFWAGGASSPMISRCRKRYSSRWSYRPCQRGHPTRSTKTAGGPFSRCSWSSL
eukprot:scaffold5647_cov134-Pinguiococcus_pyrenoidosus.AAC.1